MLGLKLLVFPLDMEEATNFIICARALDAEIVGASSVMTVKQATRCNVDVFRRLPFVTDHDFESAFIDLILEQGITHVYTPHGAIWTHLLHRQHDDLEKYKFKLCEPSPYITEWLRVDPSFKWAEIILDENFIESLELPGQDLKRRKLRKGQYASLHRQFLGISGQSDEQKLLALAHIVRVLPAGDLVEIGSLHGRSAFAIGWLASQYKLGNLVCVDPWDNEKLDDQGEQADIVNREIRQGRELIDLGKIFWSYIGVISLLNNVE